MIRSSSAYRICTHRPNFNEEAHDAIYGVVKKKADLAGVLLNSETIDSLCETKGMMTDAKKLRTSFENKFKAENDPLPDGAKTYLEERWLELNQNFHDFSLSGDSFAVNKGNFSEDAAIEVLEECIGISLKKNEERITRNFMSGECDLIYGKVIRDIKVPQNWSSFKSKTGIPLVYHWQLIAYCILYEANQAYLDYILMPTPHELIPKFVRGFSGEDCDKFDETEAAIMSLTLAQRVKTYRVQSDIAADITFLESRLVKAEEYYETLTYEKCMKMIS